MLLDKFGIAAHLLRVLLQLVIIQSLVQHLTIGAPHIAPPSFFRRNRPLHQIQIILCGEVNVAGSVNLDTPDACHDFPEVLSGKRCAKGSVDCGNELPI